MGSLAQTEKPRPHAVCIPFPAQGHINPMLKLAKLLHHRGFHITFVHTDFNHRRLLKSRGPAALCGIPSFRFETIPDGLPPPNTADSTQHVPSLCDSTRKNCSVPLRNLINKLNNAGVSSGVPPVTCVIADGVMSFAVLVAEELGIPGVLFWTTSACGFMGYMQYPKLVDKGLIPFKGLTAKFTLELSPNVTNHPSIGVKDESLDLSPVICLEQALSMNHLSELPYDLRHTYKINQIILFGTQIFLSP